MRTGIGRHRQRRARRTGAAADSGGPICATDAAEYGPEVSNAHLAFGSRRSFAGTGVDGMAVVSAIVGQPDITAATRHLKALWQQTMGTAHA